MPACSAALPGPCSPPDPERRGNRPDQAQSPQTPAPATYDRKTRPQAPRTAVRNPQPLPNPSAWRIGRAKGQTTGHVHVDIGQGVIVHASITNEAIDDLALQVGDEAFAVIKASDVMIGK